MFAIVDHCLVLDLSVTWLLETPHFLGVSPPSQAISCQCPWLVHLPPHLKIFESSGLRPPEISSNFIALNAINKLITKICTSSQTCPLSYRCLQPATFITSPLGYLIDIPNVACSNLNSVNPKLFLHHHFPSCKRHAVNPVAQNQCLK